MSDEHGHGPSNDKPWVAGLAVVAGLGIALGVGRVDPYAAPSPKDGAQALKVGGLDPIVGEVHSHGGVLQVHTPEGVVFVPKRKARVTAVPEAAAHGAGSDSAHREGESVGAALASNPLDELAVRAYNRRSSRLYDEALPLYAELVRRGREAKDPRAEGWAITLGETISQYAKDWHVDQDALERATLVRETLEPMLARELRAAVWLADAYAMLLRKELAEEHPEHHVVLGELLRGLGPQHAQVHREILQQLDRRLHPVHEGGGLLAPGR
ncbi:MAG: hypothetical protein KDD82_25725 [Planctomycetes bacterium]|nr:hypothetical protein [Planctomycetota bacterium]